MTVTLTTDFWNILFALGYTFSAAFIGYSVLYAAIRGVRIDRVWASIASLYAIGYCVLRGLELLNGKG